MIKTIIGIAMIPLLISMMFVYGSEPAGIEFQNFSETKCVGKTCTNYLLSQMGNRSGNFTIIQTAEIEGFNGSY